MFFQRIACKKVNSISRLQLQSKRRICAYVQPKENQKLNAAEILAFLKEKGASLLLLPERIELVTSLPLTAMDKVDKQKLKEDIAQQLRAEGKIQ